jgi:predicted aspartyl protease
LQQASAGMFFLPLLCHAAAPFNRDSRGRIVAPVFVNGRGPFKFAIDTAANLSMISSELAADLHLRAATGAPLQVQGSIGPRATNLVDIERLELDQLHTGARQLGLLEPAQLDAAHGLLGADVLRGQVLDLQLRAASVAVYRADALAGVATDWKQASDVPAERRFDTLLALRVRVGNRHARAILDTGAQRSIGNRALLQALGLRASGESNRDAVLTGFNGSMIGATSIATPALQLGAARLAPADILYADLPLFESWGGANRPMLLLGMDRIGQLGRVLIDYRRTRVHVWA